MLTTNLNRLNRLIVKLEVLVRDRRDKAVGLEAVVNNGRNRWYADGDIARIAIVCSTETARLKAL